jgi:hypothetical protein
VNTTLGNIKTAIAGTYHHISAKHAQTYLTSFAYRFNRRFQLDSIVERLAWAAVHTGPQPGLFGSGHERSVRARFAAARPSARLGR